MERVRFIEHNGTPILLVDCTDCRPAELLSIFQQVQQLVTAQPAHSTLILTDLSGAEFDKKAADQMKIVATYDRAHVRKSAIVGAETMPDVYYRNLQSFSAREFPVFKSREEALDWLAGDRAERAVG